ncbi:MAG: hypothetical protein JOS17DRAFT_745905 [Linnemannia elongata]|nr:MAG: hypothetical protein JOS17DRAFT_745905 [Linnemannia elongata]
MMDGCVAFFQQTRYREVLLSFVIVTTYRVLCLLLLFCGRFSHFNTIQYPFLFSTAPSLTLFLRHGWVQRHNKRESE